jgi:hypothetical protein
MAGVTGQIEKEKSTVSEKVEVSACWFLYWMLIGGFSSNKKQRPAVMGDENDSFDDVDAAMANRGRPVDMQYDDSDTEVYRAAAAAAAAEDGEKLCVALCWFVFRIAHGLTFWNSCFASYRFDAEGNPIVQTRSEIAPLPFVDHNELEYEPFEKCFYEMAPAIARMSDDEVTALRRSLGTMRCWCKKISLIAELTLRVFHFARYPSDWSRSSATGNSIQPTWIRTCVDDHHLHCGLYRAHRHSETGIFCFNLNVCWRIDEGTVL